MNAINIDLDLAKAKLKNFEKTTFSGNFKHIPYSEKINKAKEELLATNPKKVIKWGWNAWDNLLGGIYGGKIYILGGDTGTGKSTFINQLSFNLSKQNIKITKYSLEDRLEDIGKEDLFYNINRIRKKHGKKMYSWTMFVNNEYGFKGGEHYDEDFMTYLDLAIKYLEQLKITELQKEKQVSIKDLVKLMEEEAKRGTKVFLIDHLHYFKMNNEERTDLEIQNIMHDINEVARNYNVAVFLVAHYRKLYGQEPDNDSFKDASAIKQVGNIIIHIVRENDETTNFKISKIRGPIKKQSILGFFDITTFTYNNFTIN